MNLPEVFKSLSDRLQTTATVSTVYGEPVVAEGKTIIPVARVRYGFGAGSQEAGTNSAEGGVPLGTGAAGGGGVEVSPMGMIMITADETRYISFEDRRRVIGAALPVSLAAIFLLRRRRRDRKRGQ